MNVVVHEVLIAIDAEMNRQGRQWGIQNHADGYWLAIALEELGEVARVLVEDGGQNILFVEVQQAAAVLASWLECIERRENNG